MENSRFPVNMEDSLNITEKKTIPREKKGKAVKLIFS